MRGMQYAELICLVSFRLSWHPSSRSSTALVQGLQFSVVLRSCLILFHLFHLLHSVWKMAM